jgi:tetraacyldisaccharide 4'-kinase
VSGERGLRAGLEAWLGRQWWTPAPTLASNLLGPLAWLYGALQRRHASGAATPDRLPVPVLVVGNCIVGGAGKTPTVIALVAALQRRGYRPGIVSRGHGRQAAGVRVVPADGAATEFGDEPVLLARRTGVPVVVGRDRVAAVHELLAKAPQTDVIVSDDGLQHHALHRDAELVVFDERGIGNGLLLPAGPLREPWPLALPPTRHVLYSSGRASTALPGTLARRSLDLAWPLAAWHAGDAAAALPVQRLRGRRLLAAAGLAAPEKFFGMLRQLGLDIATLALPDHHDFAQLPWPGPGPDVLVTEKDAVKIAPARSAHRRVWVLPLDLALPETLVDTLHAQLFGRAPPAPSLPPAPLP